MSHAELDEAPGARRGRPGRPRGAHGRPPRAPAQPAHRRRLLRHRQPPRRRAVGCLKPGCRDGLVRSPISTLDRRPQGAARFLGWTYYGPRASSSPSRTPRTRSSSSSGSLTALDLTVFGVGVIIGAGIFTLTGRVAQANAGPARLVLVRRSPRCVAARGAVLRRVRLDGAGVGVGLHVLLRHPRRADRLDHRLGPAARDDARRVGRGAGLGVVLRDVPRPDRHHLARRARVRRQLQPAAFLLVRSSRPWSPTGSRSRCGSTWCWWPSSCSSSCS